MDLITSKKDHWERIFKERDTTQVSWYQKRPETSLVLIRLHHPEKDKSLIEIGGGNSFLIDSLLRDNYSDLTLVDISETAIEEVRSRTLNANEVKFVASDVLKLNLFEKVHLWHDRAAFHFLTDAEDQQRYKQVLLKHLEDGGKAILGTFAVGGPEKCSGLPVQQYNFLKFRNLFAPQFDIIDYFEEQHRTPGNKDQLFAWVVLEKNKF